MPTPYQNNLFAMARRIIEGPCDIAFEGDSLYSQNAPRMQQGIAQHWRPNTIAGWVTQGGCQIWDNGGDGSTGGVRTQTQRNYDWYTGSTTVAPCTINEILWDGASQADGTRIKLVQLNNTARGWFPGGDPFSNVALKCKVVFWADDTSVTQLRFRGFRTDVSAMNDTDNVDTSGPAGGIYKSVEVDIPAAVNTSGNLPIMDILTATGITELNKYWWPIAYRIYRPGVTGTTFNFVGSRGGFTATNHMEQSKCSNARRADYYNFVGAPNLVWDCLGTNNGDFVSGNAYKVLLKAKVDDRRTRLNALGVSPLFVLEVPYTNSASSAIVSEVARVMYELSQEYSDIGFLNTAAMAGNFAVLDGDGAGSAFLDADDIHQSSLGASYFPAISWAALASAYSQSRATLAAQGTSGSRVSRINRLQ